MEGLPEFYELHLIILSIICLLSLLADRYTKAKRKPGDVVDKQLLGGSNSLATLTRQYLVVYGIVMGPSLYYYSDRSSLIRFSAGADWLQGPYVYSLYHEQYAFPERLVAILFVTGFVSAGLAAPLVGVWADQQ